MITVTINGNTHIHTRMCNQQPKITRLQLLKRFSLQCIILSITIPHKPTTDSQATLLSELGLKDWAVITMKHYYLPRSTIAKSNLILTSIMGNSPGHIFRFRQHFATLVWLQLSCLLAGDSNLKYGYRKSFKLLL